MKDLKRILITTVLFLVPSAFSSPSHNHNSLFENDWTYLASIRTNNFQETFEYLSHNDIDIAGVDVNEKIIDILINNNEYLFLKSEGVVPSISEVKGVTASPDVQYKNPEEIEFLVKEFADKFPAITKRISIGKSVEGRDIWAIKISDNAKVHEVNEPSILFNSMHHAREIMTPEVSLDIIEYLLNNYNSNKEVTDWINQYEIWVIPMFNVDGNNKMWTHDKWWRKNNRGGYGVDLNRNYPSTWNHCRGSSGRRSSDTYRGPEPASEPETKAMMKFISKVRPVFDISYHSYSELVIYPMGCSPDRTSNKDVVEKIGKEIAQKLNYKAGTAWELLYNADGGDIDWMYDAYQVIPYVIELNSRRQGFHPRYDLWRDKTVKRNRPGWKHLLKRLGESGVRGQVVKNTKAVSSYEVDIYKSNSNNKIQTYVGHESGFFHLVLNEGDYRLIFRDGKNILKKEKITVGSKLLELNVAL